ncbi:glycosyltransferase [Candidatus Bathyarchaeota archaeon]|nr:glycosyltransferase [Candidatus Bathyarchaeota archaeon]
MADFGKGLETSWVLISASRARGRVVIASDASPIKEYIQHEKTGFLFRDQKEVYSYVKKLLENPGLIGKTGERARREAENYDWQVVLSRYEEMYKSIVNNRTIPNK